MNFKRLFSLLLIFFGLNMPFAMHSAGEPFPGFDPNMSEEEILEKIIQDIEEVFPKDSEEGKKFWQEVEEQTKILEQETAHMSEEEKAQYLMDLITSEPETEDIAESEQAPIEQPTIQPQPARLQAPSPEKASKLVDILKSIVNSIEAFLVKAAAFPDFDRKIKRWVAQRRINDWQDDTTWGQFKNQINGFVALLERFQEKDPKIGMKHIDALAQQEAVVQSIKQLDARLSREIPLIEVSAFSIAQMSKQTKNAIAHTVNALTEALYRTKLPEELETTIKAFDPTAKKLFEQEKKAQQKAEQKRYTSARPTRVVGKAERRSDDFYLPTLDDFGYGSRGGPSGLGGGFGAQAGSDQTAKPGAKGEKTGKASGAAAGKGQKKDDKKDKKDKGKGEDKKDAKKDEKKKPMKPDVKKHIDKFEKDLTEASDLMLAIDELSGSNLAGYATLES